MPYHAMLDEVGKAAKECYVAELGQTAMIGDYRQLPGRAGDTDTHKRAECFHQFSDLLWE